MPSMATHRAPMAVRGIPGQKAAFRQIAAHRHLPGDLTGRQPCANGRNRPVAHRNRRHNAQKRSFGAAVWRQSPRVARYFELGCTFQGFRVKPGMTGGTTRKDRGRPGRTGGKPGKRGRFFLFICLIFNGLSVQRGTGKCTSELSSD